MCEFVFTEGLDAVNDDDGEDYDVGSPPITTEDAAEDVRTFVNQVGRIVQLVIDLVREGFMPPAVGVLLTSLFAAADGMGDGNGEATWGEVVMAASRLMPSGEGAAGHTRRVLALAQHRFVALR